MSSPKKRRRVGKNKLMETRELKSSSNSRDPSTRPSTVRALFEGFITQCVKALAERNGTKRIQKLLPSEVDFAVGGCHPGIRFLNFRLKNLESLFNYFNSPLPPFICIGTTYPPENSVIAENAHWKHRDIELTSVTVRYRASSKEFLDYAIVGASKIGNVIRPREEYEITGSEEQLEEVQKELMTQIKILLIDLKQESRIRPRSQDFMVEVIKTGNVPRENINEVDLYILGTFVNEMQLLRLRKTGRGKTRLDMIDFSN